MATDKPLPKYYIRRMRGMGDEPLFGLFLVKRRLANGRLYGKYVPFSSRHSIAAVMDTSMIRLLLTEPKTRIKD